MQVQPYLFFDGRTEEALNFYKKALGAKVEMMMRFDECPDPIPPGCAPADLKKVMHASFKVGDAMIMASDGLASGKPNFQGVSLSLSVPSEADADRMFGGLADGGQVQMPMGKTFFAQRFGMVADKFGVSWMIIVPPPEQRAA